MAPVGKEFSGDDFMSDLLSHVGPLVALFAGQVTQQHLSMCLGWTDNILISMGPVGVFTIVASAIRIAGSNRMKTLIGR